MEELYVLHTAMETHMLNKIRENSLKTPIHLSVSFTSLYRKLYACN